MENEYLIEQYRGSKCITHFNCQHYSPREEIPECTINHKNCVKPFKDLPCVGTEIAFKAYWENVKKV